MIVFGVNPVLEALRAGRVRAIRVTSRADSRVQQVLALARRDGTPVQQVDRQLLDRQTRGAVHQGIVADLQPAERYGVRDLIPAQGVPLIVVLDGIEDPHNVGAILRTVDAAGAHGVIRQERHAAPLEGAAAKAAAGATSWVRVADVVNVSRAIDELKELGVWTVGLAGDAGQSYTEIDLTVPSAIVVGNEGTGLRRLVRERCDMIARIPMSGHVESLNVSVATGIVLFEAVRQRAASGSRL